MTHHSLSTTQSRLVPRPTHFATKEVTAFRQHMDTALKNGAFIEEEGHRAKHAEVFSTVSWVNPVA